MLALLLESKRRRQRRTGGVTTSVAFHVVVVGLVAATTAQVPGRQHRDPITIVRLPSIFRDPVPREPMAPAHNPIGVAALNVSLPDVRRLTLSVLPTVPPRFDLTQSPTTEMESIRFAPSASGPSGGLGIVTRGDTVGSNRWDARETALRLTSIARPRYPEVLRTAGISGQVSVQFVVDTAGRIEPNSARVLRSTHELFTRAVLDALPNLRFMPTELNGKKVRALAEMPFEFVLK